MVRTVSCLALPFFVSLSIGLAYAQSTAAVGGATQTAHGYGGPAPLQSLSKLGDPQRELAAASVRDSSGQRVGQVQAVQTNTKGSARSVQIALNTATGAGKLVTVPARDLFYDSASNALVADLSQSQIEGMPSKAGQTPSSVP